MVVKFLLVKKVVVLVVQSYDSKIFGLLKNIGESCNSFDNDFPNFKN